MPMAAAIVVLPTPPLPVTTSSSCSSRESMSAQSVSNRSAPAVPTIVPMSHAGGDSIDEQVAYDQDGLVPCIVQEWSTGEVLTLAYMNEQALRRTRESGELHLWSRSRGEQWHKGATSGNVQAVRALRLDCDGDTLLALVEPAGPACHTGERTCFHRGQLEPGAPHEVLPALERTLAERARVRPEGSYTVELLEDPARIGEKVMEEAEEVSRAAREESDERVDEESADVIYHLLVLLRSRGRSLLDAERVLDGRRSYRRRGAPRRPRRARRGAARARGARALPAAEPRAGARARSHAQPDRAASQLHRGLRDARLGLPEAARARPRGACLPAGVRRPGPARGALVVHRLPPARGAALVARRRRRSLCAGRRGRRPLRPGADVRRAAVHRRSSGLLRL